MLAGIELMHIIRKRQPAGGIEQGFPTAQQFYAMAAQSSAWQGSLNHRSKFATHPLQVAQSVEMDIDDAVAISSHGTARKLLKAVEEFHTDIESYGGLIPDYAERYRHGKRINTGFVESTPNQVISKRFCKRQQTQWIKRGGTSALRNSYQNAESGTRGGLPAVVLGSAAGRRASRGLTPSFLMRSERRAGTWDVHAPSAPPGTTRRAEGSHREVIWSAISQRRPGNPAWP
jgi:hypothetical protein